MTIFAALYSRAFSLPAPEIREFHPDADTTLIGLCHWQSERRKAKTIIIVHGLEGDASRHYVMGTTLKAWEQGFNVIRMNVRNCGGTEHLTPTLYHSGLTSDLKYLVGYLSTHERLSELYLIGFSMGGNQSLKLAGELGAAAPAALRGVVAISPPIDLGMCAKSISERQNYIYESRFLRGLKQRIRRKTRFYPEFAKFDQLHKICSLWDFDEMVTAPHFGFASALDYYAKASSGPFLPAIQIPTLIIQAQDDPFIPYQPFTALTPNANIQLLSTRYGGHVGFWQKKQAGVDNYWAEEQAVAFCKSF